MKSWNCLNIWHLQDGAFHFRFNAIFPESNMIHMFTKQVAFSIYLQIEQIIPRFREITLKTVGLCILSTG